MLIDIQCAMYAPIVVLVPFCDFHSSEHTTTSNTYVEAEIEAQSVSVLTLGHHIEEYIACQLYGDFRIVELLPKLDKVSRYWVCIKSLILPIPEQKNKKLFICLHFFHHLGS